MVDKSDIPNGEHISLNGTILKTLTLSAIMKVFIL